MLCPPPFHTGVWGFIYDWQTIIAGFLAILAAIIGAIAVYRVGNAQMATEKQKDRLRARSLAVGILPELLQLREQHCRASLIIFQELKNISVGSMTAHGIVSMIAKARVQPTPLLVRSIDQLYILEEAGATLTQLYSVTLQYNGLLSALTEKINHNMNSFIPSEASTDLEGHLSLIRKNIDDAEKEIAKFHDLS